MSIAGNAGEFGKEERGAGRLRVEVAELLARHKLLPVPGGNDAAGELMTQQEVSVGTDKLEHLRLSAGLEVFNPAQHPVGGPGHIEGVVVIGSNRPIRRSESIACH